MAAMSAGKDPPSPPDSPQYEELGDDLKAYLLQSKGLRSSGPADMEIDLDSRKRPLPSSTEEDEVIAPTPPSKQVSKKRQPAASGSTSSPKKGNKVTDAVSHVAANKGNNNIREANSQNIEKREIPSQYGPFTKAPFIVLFRIPSSREQPKKRVSVLMVAKKLKAANIKFINVTSSSFNTWKVVFPTKSAANASLNNRYIKEAGFSTFIPRYKLMRQFVIRDIPLDFSLSELKTLIEEENQDIVVMDIFRLRRRDRISNTWTDSQSVCVQKMEEDLPEQVIILKTINYTAPYQRSVRLCYNCGLFGHLSKYCERSPRCLQCAGEGHQSSKEAPCAAPKKCINCSETHPTSDRKCPKFLRQLEISKVMAMDNLPFFEARALVQKRERSEASFSAGKENNPPAISLKNYPQLPTKKGVSLTDTPAILQSHPRGRSFAASLRYCEPDAAGKLINILEKATLVKDLDVLLKRLENTIRLHESTTGEKG